MFEGIVVTLGSIFLAYAVFILTMRAIRRQGGKREVAPSPVFDVAELQALRDAGKITGEEFERLRLIILGQQGSKAPAGQRGFEVLPRKSPPID
jgi:hypothetical protein